MNQILKPLNCILKHKGEFIDINLGYDFYGYDTKKKTKTIKAKINIQDYIKLKNLQYTTEDTIHKMKRQPEKIFDKGLTSKKKIILKSKQAI